MLQFLRAFISNRETVEWRYDYLVGYLSDMSYTLYCDDRRWIYRFVDQVDTSQFFEFLSIIKGHLNSSEEDQNFTYVYAIKPDALYTEEHFEGCLEVQISVKYKSVDFTVPGVRLKEKRK